MPQTYYIPNSHQMQIFMSPLVYELDKKHPLYKLRQVMDYQKIEDMTSDHYLIKKTGRPKYEGTLMSCLLMLQSLNNTSDLKTSKIFYENVYWQYFCGFENPERGYAISESSIRRFRQQAGEELLHKLLSYTVQVASSIGLLKKKSSRGTC